ncbi:MAG: hypothetical protein R3C44_05795 [Chloroflexota bacterium]
MATVQPSIETQPDPNPAERSRFSQAVSILFESRIAIVGLSIG